MGHNPTALLRGLERAPVLINIMRKRLVDPTRAAAYCALVPGISKIAREFGYACAVHGSMASDLDLILVPWREDCNEPFEVVEAIRLFVGGDKRKCDIEPYEKPCGRLSWNIYLTQAGVDSYSVEGPYIDISVTPKGKH